MDNNAFSIDELLADESFLRYCQGNEEDKQYWEVRFSADPQLQATAEKARLLYELLRAEMSDASKEAALFRESMNNNTQPPDTDADAPVFVMYPQRNKWIWWAASAAVLIGISLLWRFSSLPDETSPTIAIQQLPVTNDALPGRNTAILVLANGNEILLDSANAGDITQQGNALVVKSGNASIMYKAAPGKPAEVVYNTMRTPKGGQYELILPDGTHAWLNAASSIKYPTAFTGNERRVSITGEVYFEVAKVSDPSGKNILYPFIVENGNVAVQVLGTHFNVNSYDDEADIRITLLEGRVNVFTDNPSVAARQQVTLTPGSQASCSKTGRITVADDVDVDNVMAWKNGLFHFSNADIQAIMRQISRWYDLDVVFDGKIPKREFSGKITRNTNVSNVLKILESSNIHFTVENKTLTVLPK